MNNKENLLHGIVNIVVECCRTEIQNGIYSLSESDVTGRSRAENVVMTRCILVEMLIYVGYSITTAADLLKRTPAAIRHLYYLGNNYARTSRVYVIAREQAKQKINNLLATTKQ